MFFAYPVGSKRHYGGKISGVALFSFRSLIQYFICAIVIVCKDKSEPSYDRYKCIDGICFWTKRPLSIPKYFCHYVSYYYERICCFLPFNDESTYFYGINYRGSFGKHSTNTFIVLVAIGHKK